MLGTKVIFNNKTKEFIAKNALATDAALAFMAQDIEIGIKTGGRTPFRKGKLRGDTYHQKIKSRQYIVMVPVEYAAVQEKGTRAGAGTFKNYTTPGTGAHFFQGAVDNVVPKAKAYFETGKKVARIG